MSYDIAIMATVRTNVYDDNHTSNQADMWCDAGINLKDWDGQLIADMKPVLQQAILNMTAREKEFRDRPSGKLDWGGYDTAFAFLKNLYEACCRNLDADENATFYISY